MKITIMGCGNQGSGMAGLLSKEEDVEQLILADIDIMEPEDLQHGSSHTMMSL